ncbi:MAG: S8 family serine peptidase [Alloprevotella sp.]|nr:S8 family serine peptidase [Alloprevotella sp.]
MKKCFSSLLAVMALMVCSTGSALAQDATQEFTPTSKFRVTLKDKKGTPFSVKHPEKFLSQKAIDRRARQGLKVDQTDLPITPAYLEQIRQTGVQICHMSKWQNTVVVETANPELAERIKALPFVSDVRLVARYDKPRPVARVDRHSLIAQKKPTDAQANALDTLDTEPELVLGKIIKRTERVRFKLENDTLTRQDITRIEEVAAEDDSQFRRIIEMVKAQRSAQGEEGDENDPVYGKALNQIKLNRIDALHEQGYRGAGMTIAIIDGGFYNADIIPMLKHVKVLGTKDFAEAGANVYDQQEHGMMVLSCIATDNKGVLVGSAPEAEFYLLRSEDGASEQLVEEDNWCAAIEYADSVGADLVNTSLGYTAFDNKADNVQYWEQDGSTHLMSRSASMAASKGMVLCQSAGNEGDNQWKRIGVPADADNILTVGALRPDGTNTDFSSLGMSADGRVKPDVCAQGQNVALLSPNGSVTQANGTSFSSPLMCGMVACFWQAHPELNAFEVIYAVQKLGDRYDRPDNVYGYGTPDFSK